MVIRIHGHGPEDFRYHLASVKPKDYVVKLTTPAACASAPPAPSELHVKEAQDYITANGVKADTNRRRQSLPAEGRDC